MHFKRTPVIALSTLMASMLLAQNSSALAQSQWLPYNPRLQVSGTWSQDGIFNADGLIPVYGNWDGFVYGDVNARYSTDKTGLLAPGLGFRYVVHNSMYGAYVFADAARTNPKANFWVINPGVEWASPHWDVHVNGYIPTKRSKQLEVPDFYSNYGDYSHLSFSGHSQYDALGALSVAIGQGLDAEVGYSLPIYEYRSRAFLGGYYFSMPQDFKAVQGVAGGIQLPLNANADLILTDSYDKLRRHEFALSVRFTLGNKNNYSDDVHTRLLEGTERHVGMWSTGAGVISQQALHATGQSAIYKDNIWFFKPNAGASAEPASLESCTFEHPCSHFDQQTIDAINQASANANFYLTPGTYAIAPLTSQDAAEMFRLNQGQSIYGRSSDYQTPATANDRAVLAGPVKALGNNVIDSVRIVNDNKVTKIATPGNESSDRVGLYLPKTTIGTVTLKNTDIQVRSANDRVVGTLQEGGNLVINNSSIQAESNAVSTGIRSQGNSKTTLNDAVILAKSHVYAAYGIETTGNSELTMIGGNVSAVTTGNQGSAYGIRAHDASQISAKNVAISAMSHRFTAFGIYMQNSSNIILAGGSIYGENSGNAGNSYGIIAYNDSRVQATDVAIKAAITGNGNGTAYGIYSHAKSHVTLTGGSVTAEDEIMLGGASAVTANEDSTIEASNVAISAKGDNTMVRGVYGLGKSRIVLNGGSVQVENTGSVGSARGIETAGSESLVTVENIQLIVNGADSQLTVGDNIHFSGTNICKLNGDEKTCVPVSW